MEVGSEDRDLVHPEVSSTPKTETDVYIAPDLYIAPVIQKIGSPSIAQIERLIGELQQAKKLSCIGTGANRARDGSLHKIHSDGFGLCQIHL
jgi:hypothetical protein